jgi:hypothetical protein
VATAGGGGGCSTTGAVLARRVGVGGTWTRYPSQGALARALQLDTGTDNSLFYDAFFMIPKHDPFTKTGSGQTPGKKIQQKGTVFTC